ncbi:MAG: DUF58 domain-containing protein [Parachlamydiaceae bacterium]|nr:DUF58 domain-containing protein [Parachlamydiaceae bacterium]
MLYPELSDLIAYKKLKSSLTHRSNRAVKSTGLGNHRSPFRGQGLEFDSVREYVVGDDIRSIDWRVTARMGAPHIKLFKEDRERHICICVDLNASMRFGTRNTFKSVQAARAAAILGWQGLDSQDRVSGCLFGDVPQGLQFFEPKRTRKSFGMMLKMLSDVPQEKHSIPFESALKHIDQVSHTGSLIYLISDFMHLENKLQHESIITRLSKRCDIVFIAINDPADKTIFPMPSISFSVDGKDKISVDTSNPAGRETYVQQWKENRQRLYEIATRLKVTIVELTTESDIHRDLILEMKLIAKRKKR